MGTVAVEFYRITKTARCLLSPRVESRGAREVVKRIVNLDRIKGLRVVGEPLRFGQVFRVKNAAPVVVMIARCPDAGRAFATHEQTPLAPLTARATARMTVMLSCSRVALGGKSAAPPGKFTLLVN